MNINYTVEGVYSQKTMLQFKIDKFTLCVIFTFYSGFAGPVAMAVGTLVGALYTFKWRPDLCRSSLVTLIALGISTMLLPIMFAFHCNLDPVIPIEDER